MRTASTLGPPHVPYAWSCLGGGLLAGLEQEGLRTREVRLIMRRLYTVSWMMDQGRLRVDRQARVYQRMKEARDRKKKSLPYLSFLPQKAIAVKRRCSTEATARAVLSTFTLVDEGVRRAILSWI